MDSNMYFNKFPTLLYEFTGVGEDKTNKGVLIRDITKNIRFKKDFIESLPLTETYKVRDGDTPEIISEKLYGTPLYHWVIMLLNQRYDYINDFPLSQRELDAMILTKYGNSANRVHHFVDESGNITNGYCTIKLTKVVKGTILTTETSNRVIGTNTDFKSQLVPGNVLYNTNNELIGTVASIQSGNQLTLKDVMTFGYNGNFKCVIPYEVGFVIRAKTDNGYAVGRIETINENGTVDVMLTSSSFLAGSSVQVFKYYDDADGNYAETYYGQMSITTVQYPQLSNSITNTEYEYALNEKNREIKVLPKVYLDQVISEYGRLMLE